MICVLKLLYVSVYEVHTVLYRIVLYCTALHCIALHRIALYHKDLIKYNKMYKQRSHETCDESNNCLTCSCWWSMYWRPLNIGRHIRVLSLYTRNSEACWTCKIGITHIWFRLLPACCIYLRIVIYRRCVYGFHSLKMILEVLSVLVAPCESCPLHPHRHYIRAVVSNLAG